MKKLKSVKKLVLKKSTVAQLNNKEMKANRAGANPSEVGLSCLTGLCCTTE